MDLIKYECVGCGDDHEREVTVYLTQPMHDVSLADLWRETFELGWRLIDNGRKLCPSCVEHILSREDDDELTAFDITKEEVKILEQGKS